MEKHELSVKQKYMQDAVYGASDGIVTTFAVVAGVSGASLSPVIVLILGFANLVADGFSMAVGSYLSRKSEKELYDSKKTEEIEAMKKNPEEHRNEIRSLLEKKGMAGEELETTANSIMNNSELAVEFILSNEFNLVDENKEPMKNGAATFGAFVVAGFMPLLAYVLAQFIPAFKEIQFELAIILTAATLIAVGLMKSSVTKRIWWKESGQMLILGGAAAVLAYLVGYFISAMV